MPKEPPKKKKHVDPLKLSPEELRERGDIIRTELKKVGQEIERDEYNWRTKGTTGDPKKDKWYRKVEEAFDKIDKKRKAAKSSS